MLAKLTVLSFIAICLMAGVFLTLLPWVTILGLPEWGDNYLLVWVSTKTNLPFLREAVASGWVRGAVTALGVLNLIVAFWEIANFNRAVRRVEWETSGNSEDAFGR
jgi:hypothetical protein